MKFKIGKHYIQIDWRNLHVYRSTKFDPTEDGWYGIETKEAKRALILDDEIGLEPPATQERKDSNE